MRIDGVSGIGVSAVSSARALPNAPNADQLGQSGTGSGFADFLRESVSELTGSQAAADQAAQKVAMGDLAHLHEAVTAVQEASLALDFVVAVRNHVVDGIQELLRTQA